MKPAEGSRVLVEHAVEAPDHEVRESAVVEQVRVRHVDPGAPRHARIGVFDSPPGPRTACVPHPPPGRVRRHPVELDEPRFLRGFRAREPGPDPVCTAIPENQRLRSGTARAPADLHDLRHRNRHVAFDDSSGLVHQIPDGERLLRTPIRIGGGMELQRPHRAVADVEKPLQGRHGVSRPPPLLEVAADDGVSELVRQGVGEDAGKPQERRLPSQFRKADGALPSRGQVNRRDVEAGTHETPGRIRR